MTTKIKIKKSDLQNLSRDELYDVARKLKRFEDAKQSLRLEEYLTTAHDGQLEFHRAKNRVRLFLGGNRCLREDQKILTYDGPISVGDLFVSGEVFGLDVQSMKCYYTLGSASFPKQRGDLYRVVHEKGEFVSSAHHRVFSSDHKYQQVLDLQVGSSLYSASEQYSSYQPCSSEALSQRLSDLSVLRLKQKVLDWLVGCPAYSYLCDQQPNMVLEMCQWRAQLQDDVKALSRNCVSVIASRMDDCSEFWSGHIHHGQSKNRPSTLDVYLRKEDFVLGEADRILSRSFEHILQWFEASLQSDVNVTFHRIKSLFAQLDKDFEQGDRVALDIIQPKSKILSIEKCGHDWLWDLSVINTNNYVTEDFTTHSNSGKTSAGTIELLWRLGGIHPFSDSPTPIKAMMLAQDFQTHVKDILIPKIMQWAPKDFFVQIEKNQQGTPVKFICKSGSVLDVKSQDQDLKVFEGSDYDYVWIDEPCQQNIFTAIMRGLIDRGGLLSFTGTPLTYPWIADLYNKASQTGNKDMYWSKFINTYDNVVNLGEGNAAVGRRRIEEFESTLNKDERAARIEGKFLHLQGLIFKEWNRTLHLIKPFKWPNQWPIWVTIDPAQAKPWAVSWIGFTPSGAKILLRSDLVEGVVEDIAIYMFQVRDELEMVDEKSKPYIQRVIIDNAANVDSMIKRQTTITEELNKHVQPVFPRIESGPKNVKQKINVFKMWLKPTDTKYGSRPSFFVFDGENDQFIYEIERYSWKTTRGKIHEGFKEQPTKKDDDVIDTVLQVALIVGTKEVGFNEARPLSYVK